MLIFTPIQNCYKKAKFVTRYFKEKDRIPN